MCTSSRTAEITNLFKALPVRASAANLEWDIRDDSQCAGLHSDSCFGIRLLDCENALDWRLMETDPYTTVIVARALVEEAMIQLDVFSLYDSDGNQELLARGRRLAARHISLQRKFESKIRRTCSVAARAKRYYADCKEFRRACEAAIEDWEDL
ncbi:hypothetical protein MIND_00097300 [Mycena indigotica]|uniref:Uncharacterized protein n=1 Tax=Mycena indigotica TaxID=2126181 RepID=A0A8H6WFI2_9AGAR|nr:uncharacterized protein MIND_00097300 [Mycena indigotica]KAF7315812.1 hypothetical protein MIND_00097300 [Mycena indigotica]